MPEKNSLQQNRMLENLKTKIKRDEFKLENYSPKWTQD